MRIISLYLITLFLKTTLYAQVWQWSVKVDGYKHPEINNNPTAFLWIPENCKKVKGVVWGMHNMIEEGIVANWQYGIAGKIKSAPPVEQSFFLLRH